MNFYSFCADITKDQTVLKNSATEISIVSLLQDREFFREERSKYKDILDGPRSIGPLFQVLSRNTAPTNEKNYKLDDDGIGPAFKVKEKISRRKVHTGHFSVVQHATVDRPDGEGKVEFAVKAQKNYCVKFDYLKEELIKEAKMYARLDHGNIIAFYGILYNSAPMELIFEYMNEGSLESYLQANDGQVELTVMADIARQLAEGLKYMAEQNFVHRDIAARNCLLHRPPDQGQGRLVAKIGDMGLARKLYNKGFYQQTEAPTISIRWMSPENIEMNRFSPPSDLWGLGIVLWEMITFCRTPPYPDYSDEQEHDLAVKFILAGKHMAKPEACPDQWYALMERCWVMNPHSRIPIKAMCQELDKLKK